MARPVATVPNVTPILRGKSITLRYKFRRIDFKQPLDIEVDAVHVGANGYLKITHSEHVTINQKIEAAVDRYKLATQIAVAADDITVERVTSEYQRLTNEASEQQAKAATLAAAAAIMPKLSAYASYGVADRIEELKQELAQEQAKYDNLMRAAGRYQDDKFVTFINSYVAEQTCSKSTIRNYNSFRKAVSEYQAETRIQDVNEDWIKAFVNWLYVTPITITYSKFKKVDGHLAKTDKISSTKTLPARKNGTIEGYVMKIKSVLNWYATRPEKLPAGCTISKSYKNYQFYLPSKQDLTLALSWDEVCELFALQHFEKRTHEKARDLFILLCATGLRQVDLKRVTGVV